MNRLLHSFGMLVAACMLCVACTPSQGPIFVSKVVPVSDTGMGCAAGDEESPDLAAIGLLDVAAGEPDVNVGLVLKGLESYFGQSSNPAIVIGTRSLTSNARDRLMVQQIVLRYSSKPSIPGITASLTDTIPLIVPITEIRDITVVSPLFGTNARARLEALSPSNTDTFQFTTTIEVQGIAEPSATPWRTQPIQMPIKLVKSELTCPRERLKRYKIEVPTVEERLCSYGGLGRRVTVLDDCCTTFSPDIPGCEQAP